MLKLETGSGNRKEQELWLKKNAFWCERLHAWISPWQCKQNRQRPDLSGGVSGATSHNKVIPRRPPACKNCPGVEGNR